MIVVTGSDGYITRVWVALRQVLPTQVVEAQLRQRLLSSIQLENRDTNTNTIRDTDTNINTGSISKDKSRNTTCHNKLDTITTTCEPQQVATMVWEQ